MKEKEAHDAGNIYEISARLPDFPRGLAECQINVLI